VYDKHVVPPPCFNDTQFAGTMGSFKAVTAKALVDASAGAPLIACVPHTDSEVAGIFLWF
jgi:hypothetical protein